MPRRRLLGIGTAGLAAAISTGCSIDRVKEISRMDRARRPERPEPATDEGRLRARPGQPVSAAPVGMQPLGLDADRDGLLYVPVGYQPDRPAPFVLMLHGAGGSAPGGMGPLRDLADEAGLILLAPDSRRRTWDMLLSGYGPDIAFIDRALEQTFGRYAVDP